MRNLTALTKGDRPRPSPADSLERAAFAHFAAATGRLGVNIPAAEVLQKLYADDAQALGIVNRTAAPLGTVGGWGSGLVTNSTAAFFGSLGEVSAMARLLSMGLPITLGANSEVSVPIRPAGAVSASWVGEGDPIPVRDGAFNAATVGPPTKLSTITAISAETARAANGEAIFRRVLREDAGLSLDAAYLSSDAATDDSAAGLLNGVTATPGYGSITQDLAALAGVVGVGGSGKVYFITTPELAAKAAILEPELAASVLPSRAVPSGRLIALDPFALAHGFDGQPDIAASREAVLHMADDPDQISDSGTADPVRSLWQTDAIALRMIVRIAFAKLNATAAAFSDGVEW